MTAATLAEAVATVQHALDAGWIIKCPCCAQTVKKYSRSIHGAMWKCLKIIARHSQGIDGKSLVSASGATDRGDYAKLKYWGLIYQDEKTKFWHITPLGEKFLQGAAEIPKYAYVFNGELLGFSTAKITAADCVKRFDIEEILDPENLAA